jgi:tRNA (mo5U34)-methyltransferase
MKNLSPGALPLRDRIEALGEWFHNYELGGISTAPFHFLGDYPRCKWEGFADAVPADLSGRTVLDIGCNAGFYAIEMKRRGAERVVAVDSDTRYLAQARLASEVLGVEIELRHLSIYEISLLKEKFDLVLFMGVLYHLRHPLLALDLIHEYVARDLLIFQSMQRGSADVAHLEPDYPFAELAIFTQSDFPAMYFIENSYSGDATNWWIPNRACAEAILRSAGFEIIDHPEIEVFICRWCDRLSAELPKMSIPDLCL